MIFHFLPDPGKTVFQLGPLHITDNGLVQGPVFFFRLSVVVLASFVLIWTTDTRDLMVSLAKAGHPLSPGLHRVPGAAFSAPGAA